MAKAHPGVQLHVVCDNYATHKTPEVAAWLERNPRITLHFTPTSGSWLNMVEIFFRIITRQAIRRGTFRSVHELTDAIRRFIDAYNERARPFAWTKTADQILAHARPTRPGARRVVPPVRGPPRSEGKGPGIGCQPVQWAANHAAAASASSPGDRPRAASLTPSGPLMPIPASSARTASSQFNSPGLHPPRNPASSTSKRSVAHTEPSSTKSQDTKSHSPRVSRCSQ